MEERDTFIGSIKDIFNKPMAAEKDEDDKDYKGMVCVDSDATPEEVDQCLKELG